MRSGKECIGALVCRVRALASEQHMMLAGVLALTLAYVLWPKSAPFVEGKEYLLLSFRAVEVDLGGKVAVMAIITYAEIEEAGEKGKARGAGEQTVRVPWDALKYDEGLPIDRLVFDGYSIQGRDYTLVRWKPNSISKAESRPRMR